VTHKNWFWTTRTQQVDGGVTSSLQPYRSSNKNSRLLPKPSQEPLPEGDGQGSRELEGKNKEKEKHYFLTGYPTIC